MALSIEIRAQLILHIHLSYQEAEIVGSSLLSILEEVALEVFPSTGNISTGNIGNKELMVWCINITYNYSTTGSEDRV